MRSFLHPRDVVPRQLWLMLNKERGREGNGLLNRFWNLEMSNDVKFENGSVDDCSIFLSLLFLGHWTRKEVRHVVGRDQIIIPHSLV